MPKGLKYVDPTQAVIAMGKDYTEMVEELSKLHAEIDLYRKGLTEIINMPPADIAADPNKPRIVATITLSHGSMTDPPEPQAPKIIVPGGRA